MDKLTEQLAEALRVCADDLEAEVSAKYTESILAYPCIVQDKEGDMVNVVAARKLLAAYDAAKANGGWLQHAAWAWRRAGMDGWALGHIKPTKENCHVTDEEFSKFEIRELVFADSQPLPPPPEQAP
jgi:hypothetical protein